jgi:hypothetical protein
VSSKIAEYTDVNMHIFNHLKSTWKFSAVQRSPPSEMALRLGKFLCFDRMSFWYEQHVDEDRYGELVESTPEYSEKNFKE